MGKDYYQILGVDPGADRDAVRQAYRRRAFELHPDRNGSSRRAEEAFKELTEAYAVLGDPERRAAYDRSRRNPGQAQADFDPADLFQDLFRHPGFASLFEVLARDFAREGLRFDERYLRRVFSGTRGGFFFGGFVFAGPWPGGFATRPPNRKPFERREDPPVLGRRPPGLLTRLLRFGLPRPESRTPATGDVTYTMPVAASLLREGGRVRVALPGPSGTEHYDVRVPAGSRPGTRLRLPGRGAPTDTGRGDLYIQLRPTEERAP